MRRATSFPHIKSSPINCDRITLVVPNMGVESRVQKVYYVFYWISTLAFLVTALQPRIVPRAITTWIFLLPQRRAPSDTTAPHVTILRSCSEQKEVSPAEDPLGKIAKEVCHRRDSVTIAIRVDRRGGSSPAHVTFGQILRKRYEGYE